MIAGGLIDTGAILALLDRDDRWHGPCREAFGKLRLPLLTSGAVLTELTMMTSRRTGSTGGGRFASCRPAG